MGKAGTYSMPHPVRRLKFSDRRGQELSSDTATPRYHSSSKQVLLWKTSVSALVGLS